MGIGRPPRPTNKKDKKMKTIISILLAVAMFYAVSAGACEQCEPCKDGAKGAQGERGPAGIGSPGANGHDGRNGRNGVTTVIHEQSCSTCIEDRIDMGDAVVAAIPDSVLGDHDKYGVFLAGGFVDSQRAVGLGAAVRLHKNIQFSLGVGTNLTEVCDDPNEPCQTHYDKLDKWAGRMQFSVRW